MIQIDPGPASSKLPAKVDIVVIGGGIIGTSTTWFLAKKGVSVLLCEKGVIAGEQSSRNWGFVRQQGRAIQEVPLIMESLRIWRGLDKEIEDNTGFHQGGVVYVAQNEDRIAGFERFLEIAKQVQLDTRLLSAAELKQQIPDFAGPYAGALTTPSDGRAEPTKAAPAIARAAARLGAHVMTNCAVRGLDMAGGKLAGVVTEHGRVACERVVLAGGAWSSLFSGRHAVTLPQLKVQNNVFRTTPAPNVTNGALWSLPVAIRRRQDGGYSVAHGKTSEFHIVPDGFKYFRKFLPAFKEEREGITLRFGHRFFRELFTPRHWALDTPSPFEDVRVLDPKPTQRLIDETYRNLIACFPVMKDVKIAEAWAGLIDVTPDAIPVISPVDDVPGFYLATGFSGHGFGIGPGAGRLASEMVTDAPTCVDLRPFRYGRFFDGSPLQLGPGV
jgi:glycine/D-amino acid oxidase-like deaminating enzyme